MILAFALSALLTAQADPAAPAAAAAVQATGQTPPLSALAVAPSDIPGGAPSDDYGLVAWCRGALGGHMQLYKAVKPEMQQIEVEKNAKLNARLSGEALSKAKAKEVADARESDQEDAEQLKAGRDYIALYARAMDKAEASGPEGLRVRGEKAAADGFGIWAAARAANNRDRMWSWLMWELPARCETAAKRLDANAGLFGQAYKVSGTNEAPALATSPAAGAPVDAAPAPAPGPNPAPAEATPEPAPARAPASADAPATAAPHG